MRLIDADALIEALVMWRDNDPHRKIRTLWERWVRKTGINVLIKVVSVFPTIEAEPVRHGRWADPEDEGGGTLWYCSKCHKPVKTFCLPPNYDYCPHCGADMRDIPTKSLSPEGQKLYDTLLARVKIDGGADNG